MAITVDGPNLLLILDNTDLIVDVETDLYSAWKNWVILSDNLKFPEAFRSVGGDPLTPGIDLGATFFLNNADGWRIKPGESSETYSVIGNLAPEDSTLPLTVPTDGAFTVLINGLQPVTQSVSDLLLQQQNAAYEGTVHLDTFSGTAGTSFPLGIASNPVSNIADAAIIASTRGFKRISLVGVIVLDQAFTFFQFQGKSGVAQVDVNGQDVSGCLFERVGLQGDFSAINPILPVRVIECLMNGPVTNFVGLMLDTLLADNISLVAGHSTFLRCTSDIPESVKPELDFQGFAVSLNCQGWIGGLKILNMTNAAANLSCDLNAARLELDTTVTAGTVIVGGVGTLTDNSGVGVTPLKDSLVDGLDVKLIKALDAGNITITGSNPFIVTVLDPDDNVTVLGTWEVTPDGKTRTRTS